MYRPNSKKKSNYTDRENARQLRERLLQEAAHQQQATAEKIDDLHEAIRRGYLDAVTRLLNQGADPNLVQDGQSPLELLRDTIFKNLTYKNSIDYYKIYKALIDKGANPDSLSEQDQHILFHLCRSPLYKPDEPSMELSHIKPNQQNKKGTDLSAGDVFNKAWFEIHRLPQLPSADRLEDALYDKEAKDFTVLLGEGLAGRDHMGVKLGSIYIEYQPGGSGSVDAKVFLIDQKNKKMELLHELSGERYNGIEFDALLPFSLNAFYGGMTANPPRKDFDFQAAVDVYRNAYHFKKNLVELALGKQAEPIYVVTRLKHNDDPEKIKTTDIVCIIQDPDMIPDVFSGQSFFLKKNEGFIIYKINDPTASREVISTLLAEADTFNMNHFIDVEHGLFKPYGRDQTIDFKPLPQNLYGQSFIATQGDSLIASTIKFQKGRTRIRAEKELPPDEFFCPISGDMMTDPVTLPNGQTFDRPSIEEWIMTCITKGNAITDPNSGIELIDKEQVQENQELYLAADQQALNSLRKALLIPNRNLKDLIEIWQVKELEQQNKPVVQQRPPAPTSAPTAGIGKQAVLLWKQLRQQKMEEEAVKKGHAEVEKVKGGEKEEKIKGDEKKENLNLGAQILRQRGQFRQEPLREKKSEQMIAAQAEPVEAPDPHLCLISFEPMTLPVMTPNGDSYQREAIEGWVQAHGTDPKTRDPITLKDLVPNYALRNVIEAWNLKHGMGVEPPIKRM